MVAYLTSNEVSVDSEILLNKQTQLWVTYSNYGPLKSNEKNISPLIYAMSVFLVVFVDK